MKEKQRLVITLPESLAELPVEIRRNSNSRGLVLDICPQEEGTPPSDPEKKYAFIWRQTDYLKVDLDEILWIEACGSYSNIHLAGNRKIVISFPLSTVGKDLPDTDFIRIHRSNIINLKHVASLIGNSLNIDGKLFTIGREYRETFFERFIFLGVRRKDKK